MRARSFFSRSPQKHADADVERGRREHMGELSLGESERERTIRVLQLRSRVLARAGRRAECHLHHLHVQKGEG